MLVMYIACMLLRTSVGTSNKNDTEHTKTTVSTDVLLQIATLSDDLSSWTVIELRSWLQQLGLDNFIPVFEKHAIRGDILFDMTNAEIVDMMARENALVYGDVLRLEKAIHKMHRTTAASAPHSMVPLPHMQEQPIGVTHALLGWSFGGITLTALIVALAISEPLRKFVNVMTQILSIHIFFICRRVIARFKAWRDPSGASKSPSKPTPKSPASVSSGETSPSPMRRKVGNATAASVKQMDLTGTWKLERNENYKDLLAFMGANMVERNAANMASTTHVIEHKGERLKISIKSLLTIELDYTIGGPPVYTEVKGTKFEDTVMWMENGGVVVRKHCKQKKLEMTVKRQLLENGKVLELASDARNLDGCGDVVSSVQIFRRRDN